MSEREAGAAAERRRIVQFLRGRARRIREPGDLSRLPLLAVTEARALESAAEFIELQAGSSNEEGG